MTEVVLIGDMVFDKNTIKAVILTLLVVTLLLVMAYYKLNDTDISLDSITYSENYNHDRELEDELKPIPEIKDGYTQLAFCPDTCSIINADTKEVIATFRKGSNNCLLLNYLFNNPDKHLTEIDIALKVSPKCPEKFYIRKAIWNLKLDKALNAQMFNKSESGIRFNTLVKLP